MPFLFLPEVLAARAAAINPPHAGSEVCCRFAFHRHSVRYALFPTSTKAAENFYEGHIRRFCRDNGIPRPSTVVLRAMNQNVQDVHCTWKGRLGSDGDHWVGLIKTGLDLADLRPRVLLQRYRLVAVELADLKMTSNTTPLKATTNKLPASSMADRSRSLRMRREDATTTVTPHSVTGECLPMDDALGSTSTSVAPNVAMYGQVNLATGNENTPEDLLATVPVASTPVAHSKICSIVKLSSDDPLGKKILCDLSNRDSLTNDHKLTASSDLDSMSLQPVRSLDAGCSTRSRIPSDRRSVLSPPTSTSLPQGQLAIEPLIDQHYE